VKENVEMLTGQFKDPAAGKMTVSFAAATLWLFLDFNVPTIEGVAPKFAFDSKLQSLHQYYKRLQVEAAKRVAVS
jgi:hypothetical protein